MIFNRLAESRRTAAAVRSALRCHGVLSADSQALRIPKAVAVSNPSH